MASKNSFRYLILFTVMMICADSFAQNSVPLGIHYQAVARDNYGNELANRKISIKFSIISGDPLGTVVYQEVHQDVTTSRYGVFSLVIGNGIPTGNTPFGELSQIEWNKAFHYLKVEVKFENTYMDMGTMQFLAVPYALYAQKSLEPGPAGPKGDPGPKGEAGDPATDNQTVSFDESNLSISGGNSVPLTSLLQNLTITKSPEGNYLGISRGNSVLLATVEADGDPTNEIQDLVINSDKLKITKNTNATEWDLTKYLDNTDNQALTYDAATRVLGISGNAGTIDLSELKNDADADPTNEIQDLQLSGNSLGITKNASSTGVDLSKYLDNTDNQGLNYNESTNTLSIDRGNSVTMGSLIAFRAKKTTSDTGLTLPTDYDFTTPIIDYNDGIGFDGSTSTFTAPLAGIYTFIVGYNASGTGSSRELKLSLNGSIYETLNSDISAGSILTRSVTMKLIAGDKIKVLYNRGMAPESGTGSFSGYKVY